MRKYFIWFVLIFIFSFIIFGYTEELQSQKIIPVDSWPKVIYLPGKQVFNPTPNQCVEAGYRLKPASKPATPEGKVISSQKLVQDENNPEKVRYEITYADKPDPPTPPTPPTITSVSADRVQFRFTTNGMFMGVEWLMHLERNR